MGMYTVVKMPITNNNPKRKIKSLKAFVFHYTANYSKGANARANRNYFQNHPEIGASAHYNIDDSEVVECIAAGWVAWHAGGKKYTAYAESTFALSGATCPNDFTVGFEMCVNADNDWEQTVENTIDFAAKKAVEMGSPNVELIRHFDVTGKICPIMYIDEAKWAAFKKRLRARIKEVQSGSAASSSVVSIPTPSGSTYTVQQGDTLFGIATKTKVSVDSLRLINGLTGSIIKAGQVLKLAEEAKVVSTVNVGSGYAVVNLPKGENLNVRQGPSTSYAVIGQLQGEQQIRLGSKHGDWWNIYFGDSGGFVHNSYLKVGAAPTSPVKAAEKEIWGTVNADILNVRAKGSTTAKIVGQLKKGEKVRLGVKTGTWWNVYFGDSGGFVHSDYLTI